MNLRFEIGEHVCLVKDTACLINLCDFPLNSSNCMERKFYQVLQISDWSCKNEYFV